MEDFIFAKKENWIFIWVVFIIVVLYFINYIFRKSTAKKFSSVDIVKRMTAGLSRGKRILKIFLLIAGLLLLTLSTLRPQYGLKNVEVHTSGIDLAIILDVSRSMLVKDIVPDRLTAAKLEIIKLLEFLKGSRISLIPFAAISFIQNPLTSDKEVIKVYLKGLRPLEMPIQGTIMGPAMKLAINALDLKVEKGDKGHYKGAQHKAILLITDGENHEGDPLKVAEELKKFGVRIYTVGVGTPAGKPVPILDEKGKVIGTQKEKDGKTPVFSKLNEKLLKDIAEKTNGKYFHYEGKSVAEEIYKEFEKLEKREFEEKIKKLREDRFQLFLLPALIFLIIESFLTDRRRIKRR